MNKKIILNNEQVDSVVRYSLTEAMNNTVKSYLKKNEDIMAKMEKYMSNYGKAMKNIENGKIYAVLDIPSLSSVIGNEMVVARLMRDNQQYGLFVIKPRTMFTLQ